MNLTAIIVSTLLMCNTLASDDCSNGFENHKPINPPNLTLMQGYDRYLDEPNFNRSFERNA